MEITTKPHSKTSIDAFADAKTMACHMFEWGIVEIGNSEERMLRRQLPSSLSCTHLPGRHVVVEIEEGHRVHCTEERALKTIFGAEEAKEFTEYAKDDESEIEDLAKENTRLNEELKNIRDQISSKKNKKRCEKDKKKRLKKEIKRLRKRRGRRSKTVKEKKSEYKKCKKELKSTRKELRELENEEKDANELLLENNISQERSTSNYEVSVFLAKKYLYEAFGWLQPISSSSSVPPIRDSTTSRH
jgi:DNA repair exonuclease SbcCD ATPase subunit